MSGLRDRVGDAIGGDEPLADWGDRVEQLLYEGERVETTVEVGERSRVVVTSHRVLTFAPGLEGANFEQVERPNVVGVRTSARSNERLLERGIKGLLVGAVMVVGGLVVNLDGLVSGVSMPSTQTTGGVGFGGLAGLMNTLMGLMASLDDMLRVGGGLALALGVLFVGLWVWDRDPTLTIEVAGGDDLHVPRPDDASGASERLERAIAGRDGPGGQAASPVGGKGGGGGWDDGRGTAGSGASGSGTRVTSGDDPLGDP